MDVLKNATYVDHNADEWTVTSVSEDIITLEGDTDEGRVIIEIDSPDFQTYLRVGIYVYNGMRW